MTTEIRQRLTAQPFLPFLIFTADGREYRVPTPDHAQVSPAGGRVSVWTDDDTHFILQSMLIRGVGVANDEWQAS